MHPILLNPAAFSALFSEKGPQPLDPFTGSVSPFTALVFFGLLTLAAWWLLRAQVAQVEPFESHHDGHDHHGGHGEEGTAHHAAAAHPAPTAAHPAEAAPPAPAAEAAPDDLRKIEGIGPKVQEVLNAAGITTFVELAQADPGRLQEILDGAGYPYMNPTSWPDQARLAAAGDWEALQKLQDELNAGKA